MIYQDSQVKATYVSEAMDQLKEVRAVPMKGKILWIKTDIAGDVAERFKAIGVKIPSKQLKVE